MNLNNNFVQDRKHKLLNEFISENPVDINKYPDINKLQLVNINTNENHLLINDQCLKCCKKIDETELYKVVIPCLVFPKYKYMIKGEKIRWEEISLLICKEHLYLVDIMKEKKEYPIGWDDWDILDSLSCIFTDLINNKE